MFTNSEFTPSGIEPSATVGRVAVLNQVSVLVLVAGRGATTIPSAIAHLDVASSRIVVIDCLGVDDLPLSMCAEFVLARRQLSEDGRLLIVVNAPEHLLERLRIQGVEVSTTTDRVFISDVREHPDRDATLAAFHAGGCGNGRG